MNGPDSDRSKRSGPRDFLETNVERLFRAVEPRVRMTEEDRARVAAAVRAAGSERTARAPVVRNVPVKIRLGRVWSYVASLSAAAIVVVAAVTLLGGPGSNVAWADVSERIHKARSFCGMWVEERRTPEGSWIRVARLFGQDPGRQRSESLRIGEDAGFEEIEATCDAPVESITIADWTREDRFQVILFPDRKEALRYTKDAALGDAAEQASPVGPAEFLDRLKSLESRAIRRLGEREIDGTAAVGFETPMTELPEGASRGLYRIWVDAATAAPTEVEMEVDFHVPEGCSFRSRVCGLVWEPDLPAELFELAPPAGWAVADMVDEGDGYLVSREARGLSDQTAASAGRGEWTREFIYRVSYSEDNARGWHRGPEAEVEEFVELARLRLLAVAEEVLWRPDQGRLLVRVDDGKQDEPATPRIIEWLMNLTPAQKLEFFVVAPHAGEAGAEGLNLETRRADLVELLREYEASEDGLHPGVDLTPLSFEGESRGRKVLYRWLPVKSEWDPFNRFFGFFVNGHRWQKETTFDALRWDEDETDEEVASRFFRLVQVYEDPQWRFESGDVGRTERAEDAAGRLAAGFELREERKEE